MFHTKAQGTFILVDFGLEPCVGTCGLICNPRVQGMVRNKTFIFSWWCGTEVYVECMLSVLVFDVQTIPKLSKGQRFCNKEIRTDPTVVSRIHEDFFCSVVKSYLVHLT